MANIKVKVVLKMIFLNLAILTFYLVTKHLYKNLILSKIFYQPSKKLRLLIKTDFRIMVLNMHNKIFIIYIAIQEKK